MRRSAVPRRAEVSAPGSPDPWLAGLAGLVAAAGIGLASLLGPADTYWTVDNGGKALVLAGLREDPPRTWLEYPGQVLDPDLRWFPQPLRGREPYAVRDAEGRVRSQYASPFVWMALPFAAAGRPGLAVWPALGAGAAVLLTGALASRRAGRGAGRRAAAVLALASPLLFYASVFWEHTLVVALAAAAFLAVAGERARPFACGLLSGSAGLLREECFLLVPALGIALLAQGARPARALPRFAGGAAIGVAAALAFHRATTGSWTGVHVAVNRPDPLVHAAEAVRGLLLSTGAAGPPPVVTLALIAALAAARFAPRIPARHAVVAAGVGGLGVLSLAAWIRFPAGQDEALALIGSNSTAVFLPWAIAAPLLAPRDAPAAGAPASGSTAAPDRPGRRDPLPIALGAFVLLFVLLVPQRSITGVHPGPRMLLPVLPVAAVLLAERFPVRRLPAAAMLLGLTMAAGWGARSLLILHDKRDASGRLLAAIAGDPRRVVATDLFWLPTELPSLWKSKQLHLVRGPDDLTAFRRAAAGAGETEVLFVTGPGRVAGTPLRSLRPARFPAFAAELHAVPAAAGRGDAAP
jgi:hypothetical protein